MLNPQVNRRRVSVSRRLAFAMLLIAIAVPIAAAARAQNTPGGTVADPSGRPLGDAAVRLQGMNSEQVFDTKTDANGNFQLPEVPAGDYLLSVRSPGFSTQRQRIRLAGGAVTFTIRLPVGTLRETVTVRGPGQDGQRYVQTAAPYAPPTCGSNVGGQLSPPAKIRDVRPRYKQAWNGQNLKGSVMMQATIGTDGRVRNVELISGTDSAELDDEAIAAVSLWEFSPTYLNCEPVEVRMFVTVNFTVE
ncbi:MAG: TonB family protein [Cyanobacteria bacterium]|nr:TonB family protein [Cyanobacteriota bacterium]